ncbi:hypothetical protein KC19_VG312900 [Ceratodon purpureus]|uniref:Uncharacterized protein n=1 Tax=Ceratodon purpureus TaxID=3225 RepID=A0A8T0HVD5_CERPU|nr:hypothetical protein KC19_VG312900 [Ceratodon purpureus]
MQPAIAPAATARQFSRLPTKPRSFEPSPNPPHAKLPPVNLSCFSRNKSQASTSKQSQLATSNQPKTNHPKIKIKTLAAKTKLPFGPSRLLPLPTKSHLQLLTCSNQPHLFYH